MSARFGDFIALAADHLADAGKMHVGEQSELRRKQLIAQIADFTEVLIGVEQRFAWEPVEALPHRSPAAGGLFPPEAPVPVDSRSELHMSLTEAAAHLRKAQGTLPTGLSQPPQHLPRAGQALRTGLDLLATHTGPDGDPLSRHGLALESDELRSAVLARVMPLAATAGDLASRLAAATNGSAFPRRVDALTEADRKLHAAAEQAQILSVRSRAEGYDRALDLLAPRIALRADPPRTAETVDQLAAGAAASADRLTEFAWRALDSGDQHHFHTAAAMGTAAANISAIYSLTRTLTTHAVGQPVEPDTLLAAERRWRELAACWRPVRTAPDSPTSMTPVSAESHALVDRVGRLLFADPGWRLADGGDRALRDAAELIDTLPTWSEALRHVNGQLQHLAQDHAALTQKLAETRRLLMRASGPVHNRSQVRPLIPERQAELRDGYLAAAQASGAVEDVLAQLATSAGVDPAGRRLQHLAAAPPVEAADRALVRQSAARLTEQGHPAQPDQRWALSAKMRFQGRGSRF